MFYIGTVDIVIKEKRVADYNNVGQSCCVKFKFIVLPMYCLGYEILTSFRP